MLYTKHNPYQSFLKEREQLSSSLSCKRTFHLVLDLSAADLSYEVGDSIGVLPINSATLVEKTLQALKLKPTELVLEKETQAPMPLQTWLAHKANLREVSRKFLQEMAKRQTNTVKQSAILELLDVSRREELKLFLRERELWDILLENPEANFSATELPSLLMPLLPRLYSIASSMKEVGHEVHLTVGDVFYNTLGHERRGVCTQYLCETLQPGEAVSIFVQPSHGFTLPVDNGAPIIMVGPGTGIAPFRGFMQERQARSALGANWLFFGEWHRDHQFFYRDYWQSLQSSNQLRLDLAFSRDQPQKVYVQHKMLEKGQEIYDWLKNGAYLYVCGDAQRMAKDVEQTLLEIIQAHGSCTDKEAWSFIKQLRHDKKYLRDVY